MKPESSAAQQIVDQYNINYAEQLKELESWLNFFSQAGIPTKASEDYAIIFAKNQIQLDMLPEITKEYLIDMNITLLGHIIAILRHAKSFYKDEMKKLELPSRNVPPLGVPKQKPSISRNASESAGIKSGGEVQSLPTSVPKRKNQQIILKSNDETEPITKIKRVPESVPSQKICKDKERISSQKGASVKETLRVPELQENEANKKGIFKRLGIEVNQWPNLELSSTLNGSNDSVFSRLGGKMVATSTPKSVNVEDKHEGISQGMKKGIIRTRLESKPRLLVSPSYMDTEKKKELMSRFNSTWSPGGLKDHRGSIKYRLGDVSLQKFSAELIRRDQRKRVSFGSVQQKLIPRENTNKGSLTTSFGFNFNPRQDYSQKGSLALSSGVFSRLGL